MKKYSFLMLILSLIFFSACDSKRIYETNIEFKDKKWYIDSTCTFTFKIEDKNLKYNILYNVRNTLDYPFYNLYVTYYLYDEAGKQISTDLHEMQLMDAKTGSPFGKGMGDIFDNTLFAMKDLSFSKSGTYKLKIKQYMRKNPINEIIAFGVRVEKAN